MSAIEAYAQLLKTAASGERPHSMIPGRTTGSKRGTAGTLAPTTNPIRVEPLKQEAPEESEEPKAPKAPKVPRSPASLKLPGMPKVDISFSVKVGSQQRITPQSTYDPQPPLEAQGNTGANVDGSFQPDSQIGGSYGNTSMPEERDSMRTPALPFGDNGNSEYVGDIKMSSPIPEEPSLVEPPVPLKDLDLQALLATMKQQNSEFYAQNAEEPPLAKSGADKSESSGFNPWVASGIAGAGFASPFAGMIGESKIDKDPYYNENIKRMTREEILEQARPGDLAMVSRRSGNTVFKTPQELVTGSEFFHVDPVISRNAKTGPITMEAGLYNDKITPKYKGVKPLDIMHDAMGTPLSERIGPSATNAPYEDMVLIRPKKPMTSLEMAKYRKLLATKGKQNYGSDVAVRSVFNDLFVPKIKGVTDKICTLGAGKREICSTLPAEAYEEVTGTKVVPGKHAKSVMPADLLRASSPYEAVGTTLTNAKAKGSLRKALAKRLAFRAAVGTGVAGMGLGSYSLYKHLQKDSKDTEKTSSDNLATALSHMRDQNSEFYAQQFSKQGSDENTGFSTDAKVNAGIAGASLTAPFMGMIGESKITEDPYYNSKIKRMDSKALGQMAQPGDIVLTSTREGAGTYKNPQLGATGSEFYHAEPIIHVDPKQGPISMEAGLYDPDKSYKYQKDTPESILKGKKGTPLSHRIDSKGLATYEDAVLMRPKKPMSPQELETYRKALATGGRARYGKGLATRAMLRDLFLPKIKGLTDRVSPLGADCNTEMCSSLPSDAYEKATGGKITRGKHTRSVLPADLMRADSPFEAVGASLRNTEALSKSPRQRMLRRLAYRGGIGAGIAGTGLVAYNEPEALVAAGAGAAAPIGVRALADHVSNKATKDMAEGSRMRGIYEKLQKKLHSVEGIDNVLVPHSWMKEEFDMNKTLRQEAKRKGVKYVMPEVSKKYLKKYLKGTIGLTAGAGLGTYGLLKGLRYLNRDKEE